MRAGFVCFAAVFGLMACSQDIDSLAAETPAASARIDVDAQSSTIDVTLTPAAEDTLAKLLDLANTGTYNSLARLADQTPGFVSNYGGVNHKDFWYLKYRTGDWPTRQLGKVLAYPPGVEETSGGRVFVWPYMALAGPLDVTPDVARDMTELVGDWQAEAVRAGQAYQGYRVGVREDGVWLYFFAGEGF